MSNDTPTTPTSLNDYKVKFDQTTIPWTNTWEVSENDILNENQSEGGTDIVEAIRKGKLSIAVQTTCLSDQLKVYAQFERGNGFTLTLYDPVLETTTTKQVRIKGFRYSKKAKSEKFTATRGIWNVSFTIEEF